MTILAILLLLIGGVEEGHASQYNPGVMEATIEARQAGLTAYDLPQKLPRVDCFVARPYRDEIGDLLWARVPGETGWMLCLVTDCGGIADGGKTWMLRNNILVEFDHETVKRLDKVGVGFKVQIAHVYSHACSMCDTYQVPRLLQADRSEGIPETDRNQ
jgi:hypothetical protein